MRLTLIAALVGLFVHGPIDAQVIDEVAPDAAKPGDLVIIRGTGLAGTTSVEFIASLDGIANFVTIPVTPITVSPTRVDVLMPTMPNFVAPVNPYLGLGAVRVIAGANSSNSQFVFYIQAQPTATTLGQGTTQPGGLGRPVSSFSALGGAPLTGNSTFVLTLENGIPGAVAWMGFGYVDTAPYIMIFDGTLLIDIQQLYNVHPVPFVIDTNGAAFCPFSIPPGTYGFTAVVQWIVLTPGTGSACITNGLVITF